MGGQAGLFDLQDRYAELSKSGDPLERLLAVVDFEVFRPTPDVALGRKDRSRGGRPPLDAVMMFKILVLEALYGLSDEQAEYQVRDRLSFMRFLDLGLGDRVPDRTTIWLFRETLVTAGAMEKLFARFDEALKERGYFALAAPTVRRPMKKPSRRRAAAAWFISASPRDGRCRGRTSAPTAPARRYGPPSSMCSPTRRSAWGSSSVPSASGAPR